MATIRQEKVSELIRRDLSTLFQKQAQAWFGGLFITVTQVRMAPDLGLAKVYLSFMAVPDKKVALEAVRAEGWRVRKALAERIGKQVRIIPELNFYLDDSLDYYEAVDQALKR
jgi:ribosome-binding factor A